MKQFLSFFSWEDIILNMESTYRYIKKKEKKKREKKACLQQSQDLQCHAVTTAFLFSLTQKKILVP